MSLKFGKTIRTLRLCQNYLVLIKIKSISDRHAKKQSYLTLCNMAFNLLAGGCK